MWKLLALSGALILATATAPLRSEELPWCVQVDAFTKNCAFANYNECVGVAKNADAKCIRNPNFQPAAIAAPAKPVSPKPVSAKPTSAKPTSAKPTSAKPAPGNASNKQP